MEPYSMDGLFIEYGFGFRESEAMCCILYWRL